MSEKRRDSKNRILQNGESQRKDGKYEFKYVDVNGTRRSAYSWKLVATDQVPEGKRCELSLREMEKQIRRDLEDGISTHTANSITLNELFDTYMSTKELKQSTRTNYMYMYKNYVSNVIGKRRIGSIKYSDIKKFYNSLILEKKFKPNSMEIINTIIHPIFTMAVRDGYIRMNPSDGVMAEIKKSHNWEKPKRHALTEEQQALFIDFLAESKTYNHWLPLMTVFLGKEYIITDAKELADGNFRYSFTDMGASLMGEKAYFIAVPTSAGTGSEVTPFAVITDEQTGVKYPLADYELLPNMAIIDTDFHMSAPKGLTAASGIDAVTHAVEAYAAMLATDYTDGLALQALKNIFKYLPRAYENGQTDVEAREKMANAATMAGMAFANAFLGVCHSMAHKLGAFHHLPHGVANALMIEEVLRFNAAEAPAKMGTFSQYDHPHTLARYAEVADYLGIKGNTDTEKLEGLIKAINDLKARVGIKETIKDYGVDEKVFLDNLDEMVEQAFDDQCTGANPRYPLMSEIKQMYLNAYYGRHENV